MVTVESIDAYLSQTLGDTNCLALFLDYDGTLSPISPHPDKAKMPEETKILVKRLSESDKIYTAIISGRQADNAKSMIDIDNITYAGSHGFEIIYPDMTRYHHETPPDQKKKIQNIIKDLNDEIAKDGAWVENKGDVLTFHYRNVPKEKHDDVIKQAHSIISRQGLKASNAIYGLEVQPEIHWNKGHAAKYLLEKKYGKNWNDKVKMLYIGDDTTDERVMEMFRGQAATFRVAASESVPTAAGMRLFSLQDVVNVLKLLEKRFC